ncbi:MAG: cation-translocating P-type ATPase [Clostridia bacterium]|nr:cation-translocating P-type ATPase [Clostridia bacterium]
MYQEAYLYSTEREYALNIPGRLRIKIDILKKNPALSAAFISFLSSTPGIIMVSPNIYTAKVLIVYDPAVVTVPEIEHHINKIIRKQNSSVCTVNAATYPHKGNASTGSSKVIMADFKRKRILSPAEFAASHNVLSKETRELNYDAMKSLPSTSISDTPWHELHVQDIEKQLETHRLHGLTLQEAQRKLQEYGPNKFEEERKKSLLSIFLKQFDGFIIKLLFAASGVSLLLGQIADAVSILVIMGVEAVIGAWQGNQAEKSLESLKKVSSPTATLIRNGKRIATAASNVVPGDILSLEAGNIVPADARLIESSNLEVIESSLTGESFPISKQALNILPAETPLPDRSNMIYMGTSVVRGNAKAIVVHTGVHTQMGKIADMMNRSQSEPTPLQKDLERLGKIISLGCLGICSIITLSGVLGGQPAMQMLATGVSLAVGAIPEGLSTVLAISLAFVAQRMAKKKAIVKSTAAVEALSCTKVICTDKTGTLTKNEMTVKKIFTLDKQVKISGEGYNSNGCFSQNGCSIDAGKHEDLKMLLTTAAKCNNARISRKPGNVFDIQGDPTEAALLVAVEKSGISLSSFECFHKEHEIAFDASVKRMTSVCSDENRNFYSFSKGAVDALIQNCSRVMRNNIVEPLREEDVQQILEANDSMAENALRVIAVAYKPLGSRFVSHDDPEVEKDLIFLGLIGMMDPPRIEVKEAIKKCHKAGIKVVMITGDHKKTAESIAKSIGLLTEEGFVRTGAEIEKMSETELNQEIDRIQVFARTCPEQKLKIIKVLKRKGYIVAMTGDGINDAPALKEANIGIAMGKSGTEVTKEAATLVLMDDNFNTIVKAIEEGRTIHRNIKKFMKYVLSGNFAEVLVIFLSSILGLPAPLIPAQILMLNLVTEGIPALSLGVDPPEKDVMVEPPRDPSQTVLDKNLRHRVMTRGFATGLATLGVFSSTFFATGNVVKARTLAFASLVSGQMLHAFECSSTGSLRNKYLLPSVAISTGLMLSCIYLPALSSILGTAPIGIFEWGIVLFSMCVLGRLEDFIKDILYLARLRNKPSFGV